MLLVWHLLIVLASLVPLFYVGVGQYVVEPKECTYEHSWLMVADHCNAVESIAYFLLDRPLGDWCPVPWSISVF